MKKWIKLFFQLVVLHFFTFYLLNNQSIYVLANNLLEINYRICKFLILGSYLGAVLYLSVKTARKEEI